MKRVDIKKTEWTDPNWNAPSREVDASTVELSGTQPEAELLVRGLKVLLLEKQKVELLTGASHGSIAVRRLLDAIEEPNYEQPVDPIREATDTIFSGSVDPEIANTQNLPQY